MEGSKDSLVVVVGVVGNEEEDAGCFFVGLAETEMHFHALIGSGLPTVGDVCAALSKIQ